MRQERWFAAVAVTLTLAHSGLARGESHSPGAAPASSEAARFEELRRELIDLRKAYSEWTGSEPQAESAIGSRSGQAPWRQTALEHEYERLQNELQQLIAKREHQTLGDRSTEELAHLRDRARRGRLW